MGRSDQQRWIGAGLTRCSCGEPMGATACSRLQGGERRRYRYLRCRAVGRSCDALMVPLAAAQAHVLTRLSSADFAVMLTGGEGQERAMALAVALQQQEAAAARLHQLEAAQAAGQAALSEVTDAAVLVVLAQRQATLAGEVQVARQQLEQAQAATGRAQATPSLEALGAAAQQTIRQLLATFASGADTVDDRRLVARHLQRLGLRITIDSHRRLVALQVGDGAADWQPLDTELAGQALADGATDAQFFRGDADGLGAGSEWPM
jgi:hypothetical protein